MCRRWGYQTLGSSLVGVELALSHQTVDEDTGVGAVGVAISIAAFHLHIHLRIAVQVDPGVTTGVADGTTVCLTKFESARHRRRDSSISIPTVMVVEREMLCIKRNALCRIDTCHTQQHQR
jgi:hypothetical protein